MVWNLGALLADAERYSKLTDASQADEALEEFEISAGASNASIKFLGANGFTHSGTKTLAFDIGNEDLVAAAAAAAEGGVSTELVVFSRSIVPQPVSSDLGAMVLRTGAADEAKGLTALLTGADPAADEDSDDDDV